MKTVRTIWLVAVVLFLCACPALGVLEFKDGLTHDIDYAVNESVRVDYEAPYMHTTVNILTGLGYDGSIEGCENSMINIYSGYTSYVYSYDSSQVNISGGSLGFVSAGPHSQVNISGGSMTLFFVGAQVNISGGRINPAGCCFLYDQGTIKIFGSDFAVDGQPFGSGELTSTFGGSYWDEPDRHLTGTLVSGELIDSYFRIGDDARIVLIPEPATVLLLGLGGLFLRKRQEGR